MTVTQPPGDRRAFVVALTLLCGTLAALATRALEDEAGTAFSALLVGFGVLAAELRPLHAARRGERHSYTWAEGPFVIGLALANGVLLVVALAAGVLVSQVIRRLPPIKLAFNVAQYALAAAVGSLIADRVGSSLGVILGVVAFCLLNDFLVQLVLRVVVGARVLPFWGRAGGWFVHLAAATTGALLLRRAVDTDDQTLAFAFVGPLFLIWYSQLKSIRQLLSERVLSTIARLAPDARPGGRRGVAVLVTTCARELLASTGSGVLVLDGPRPLLSHDDNGQLQESRLGTDWYAPGSPWRQLLDAGSVGLVKGRWAGIALVHQNETLGVLYVERAINEEPLRPDDLKVLRELATHATKWLARASAQEEVAIADLEASVSAANPQLIGLLAELDVLRSRLEGATQSTVGASLESEVDELQRRLADVIAGKVAPEEAEVAVEVGRWPSWQALQVVGAER